ncbi:MAG: RagB/SusD family nutrient uptake outer membrane protein [Cyclobacteriaceae bacterium]
MKIYSKLILSTILSIAFLTGCSDYLDVEPRSIWESNSFYSSAEEAQLALAGIYRVIAEDNCYGQTILFLDAGTDEAYHNRRNSESWQYSLYRNTSAYPHAATFWTALYEAINLANLYIESLNPDTMEEDDYNALIAEAKFLRAFCYFNLTNFWNEVPLRLKSSKDQSDNNQPAASLTELYNVMIADFTEAYENLPNPMEATPGRANSMAARGLLARLYLKMSGFPYQENHYQDAFDQCQAIIASGYHSLTKVDSDTTGYESVFKDLIGSVYNTEEVIFELSYQNLRDQGLFVNGRYGNLNGLNFGSVATLGVPNGYGMYGVMPTLSSLYDKEFDKRAAWNTPGFSRNGSGDIREADELSITSFCPGKYRRWEPANFDDILVESEDEPYVVLENAQSTLSRNFTSINVPILRYSDVLLMAAEAENQLRGPGGALQYINEVRVRAGLDLLENAEPTTAADQTLFHEEIIDERSRELCFENLRKFDLIRWGKLGEKLERVRAIVTGHPDFRETNSSHTSILRGANNFDPSKHLSLPYPLFEVNINQALEQKPEWQ